MTVADILGPWIDSDFDSGLIERCRRYWDVPLSELTDLAVATYLEQDIATSHMMIEAQRRLDLGKPDDSEYFDGQLAEALDRARTRPIAPPVKARPNPPGEDHSLYQI